MFSYCSDNVSENCSKNVSKSFQNVSELYQNVSEMYQNVSELYQVCFKIASTKFQKCFNFLVYGIWIIWNINYMEYGLVLYAPSYILLIWISIICTIIYTSYPSLDDN